jgi:phasin family protein
MVVTGKSKELPIQTPIPFPIERALVDLNLYPFPDTSPAGGPEAIFDRMSIEIARGCTEGCRFCQAGMIYRPVRERDPEQIVDTVMRAVKNSGQDEVSLTALSTAERIASLNLSTARATIEDAAAGAKSVLTAKDPQAAVAAQAALAQPAVEKAVAYSRSVYEITSETQQQLAKMVEAQFGDFQKSVASLVEMAAKSAPAGSEGAVAAIQNAIATANAAFGNMNAMAKQFADAAQSSVTAATKKGR